MHTTKMAASCCPLALALLACSSPASSGTGASKDPVDGSVAGQSLDVAEGAAVSQAGGAIPALFVVLGDRTGLCPLLMGATGSAAAGSQIAHMTSLEIQIFDQRTDAVASGTFPIPSPTATTQAAQEADVAFSVTDSTCTQTTFDWATEGSVTITSVQSSVAGTYDLQFGADHLSGSFDAALCDGAHVQGTGGTVPSVCEP